jgi:nucleoside-diphosphate-sugar epimerase
MSPAKTVLLTGASGVVGQALLPALRDVNLVCLVHRSPVEDRSVESLEGDIARPDLGLSTQELGDLCRRIDYVVHSAAVTSFGLSREATYRVNVEGTRNVAGVALKAGVPLCHISTAFAHLEEFDSSHHSNFYEASKLEAEKVVESSGVPNVILRPSIVVGDSQDGSMARFQGFHFMCELMFRGILPSWVPTRPSAHMDFIPQDILAQVVAAVVKRPEMRGAYWLTSGPRALRVDQAVAVWEQHIPRLTGRMVKRPRYVDPDVIDRFVRPVFLPALPARLQSMINEALQLLSFSIEDPLPTSLPELETQLGISRMPDPELSAIRNAEFWASKRGLLEVITSTSAGIGAASR